MAITAQGGPIFLKTGQCPLPGQHQRGYQNDVSQLPDHSKGVGAVGGDVYRRMGLLNGFRHHVKFLNLVILAAVIGLLMGPDMDN